MTKISGRSFLLKTPLDSTIANGQARPSSSVFETVGGFQSNNFDLSASLIDITTKLSENRTILNERGIVMISTSGEGFVDDTNVQRNLEVNALNQKLRWFSLERDDGRVFTARFKLTALNFSGSYDDALAFNSTLESSGTIYIDDESGDSYNTDADRYVSFDNNLATFDVINTNTTNFLTSSQKRDDFVDSFVQGYSLINADKVQRMNGTGFVVDGSTTAGEEGFPVFFIQKSDLTGRVVQVLNADVGENIDDLVSVRDLTDDTGVVWRAFYIPQLRGLNEGITIDITVGDA